jgi:ribosome-associated protein
MLIVNSRIRIPDSELEWSFVRSSGPGGQNVNKVSSKAVLRWHALTSSALPIDIRARFQQRYASRLTTEGDLVLSSQRYRDQGRNIEDVKQKLIAMLEGVSIAPKKRRPTKPSKGAIARRRESKQAVSKKKQLRRGVGND